MVNKVTELSIKHVLLFVITAFLLYYFVGNCRCINGFSVGGKINCSNRTLLEGCVSGSDCRQLCNNSMYDKDQCKGFKFYGETNLGINEYGCQYNDTDGCLGFTNYDLLCNNSICNGSNVNIKYKKEGPPPRYAKNSFYINKGEVLNINNTINIPKDYAIVNKGIICISKTGKLLIEGTLVNGYMNDNTKSLIYNEGTISIYGKYFNNFDSITINNNIIKYESTGIIYRDGCICGTGEIKKSNKIEKMDSCDKC